MGEVVELHREAINEYGGSHGLRDLGRLEAAVAMPRAGSGDVYYHTDLWEMAAAYLFHIVDGHPFIDGNKRTGLMTANVFLRLNGLVVVANEDAYADLVLAVASGQADKTAIADFLRGHTAPAADPS